MIEFNFDKFLTDNELSVPELAAKLKIKYRSLVAMMDRGTVKPSIIRIMKKKFSKQLIEKYKLNNGKGNRGNHSK